MSYTPDSLFLPDYDEVNLALFRSAVDYSAAELHGLISAQICRGLGDMQTCTSELLEPLATRDGNLDLLRHYFQEIYQVSEALLNDENFGFELLLPDDDLDISDRLVAIGEWCDGFISGLSDEKQGFMLRESDEISEALTAVQEIADVDPNIEDANGAEHDYLQLVEFLRMSVVLIYEDSRLGGMTTTSQTGIAATLH